MHDPINKIIMREIGLGVDNSQKVIDQDTREILNFKEKNIKYSSQGDINITKNDILFDPTETKNLINSLFNHFTKKIESEEGTYVSLYYDIPSPKGIALEAVVDGEKLTSAFYKNDTLRYLDIIMQINGADKSGLKQLDSAPVIKKDTKKKK